MGRKKNPKILEKNVNLVKEDGFYRLEGLEGEELKGEGELTKELEKFLEKGLPIDISMKLHKPKKEKEAKPKLFYICGCGTKIKPIKGVELNIICKDCGEKFEITEEK